MPDAPTALLLPHRRAAAAAREPGPVAVAGVGRWIEERFNRLRRHSSIKMMTQVQYENHLHQTTTLAA